MDMYQIILNKRNGRRLSKDEIKYFVKGYSEDKIPDYQASALLMTFFFNDLNHDEVFALTDAMKNSGDIVDLSGIDGIKVDKHSTGGVGDKTTLIVAPLAAACGVSIAKMSGRGLGFTGGTVDKMESIPGMKTTLTEAEFTKQVNEIGISVIGQTGHIAPADKKIYALRDVTATVDNLGLIASSIMSKKLAAGTDAIILDVKCGQGAFMETLSDAQKLGQIMVEIGKEANKNTVAVVTDMNQPLGYAVGNSLEVIEAIETLKGNGPEDITNLSIELATQMVMAGSTTSSKGKSDYESTKANVVDAIKSGKGLDKLGQLIKWQGGNPKVIDDYDLFEKAKYSISIRVDEIVKLNNPAHNDDPKLADISVNLNEKETLYMDTIDGGIIGTASQKAGAGRSKKDDIIDMSAGIILNKKVGNTVNSKSLIATIYGNDESKLKEAKEIAKSGFKLSHIKPKPIDIIKDIIK